MTVIATACDGQRLGSLDLTYYLEEQGICEAGFRFLYHWIERIPRLTKVLQRTDMRRRREERWLLVAIPKPIQRADLGLDLRNQIVDEVES